MTPVPLASFAPPPGLTLDGPWISTESGATAWTYGTTSSGLGALVSFTTKSGGFTSFPVTTTEEGAVGGAYSSNGNLVAFTARRAGLGNRLAIFDVASGVRISQRAMGSDETFVRALAFDSTGANVFVGTNSNPARIYKVASATGNATASLTLTSGNKDATSVVVNGSTLIVTLNTSIPKILTVSTATMSNTGYTALPAGTPALVDPIVVGGLAYYGSESSPGRITAIDLSTLTVVGSLDLETGESGARSLTVDRSTGLLYATTQTETGARVVTVTTNALARVGHRDLEPGSAAKGVMWWSNRLAVGLAGTNGVRTLSIAPPPTAPHSVTVTERDSALDVSWSPSPSVETIDSYTVSASGGGASRLCTSSSTSCTIAGLTNGVDYAVTVSAQSIAGSTTSSVVMGNPWTFPAPPSLVIAERRNRSLAVSWSQGDDGGRPIDRFVATALPGGATCVSTTNSCLLDGLTNGVPYTVHVRASTVKGDSKDSEPTATVTPATRPNGPNSVVTVRGDRSVAVEWSFPTDDGGSPISTFDVTTIPASAGCVTTTTSCVLRGLSNGREYRVFVAAVNDVGTGQPTEALNAVTPASVPGPVHSVVAMRGDRHIHLNWSTPTDDGGDPVIEYRVVDVATGALACSTSHVTCTVEGLTNGATYVFSVTAVNSIGSSAAAISPDSIPARRPNPVSSLNAARGNGEVSLDWATPLGNAGVPIVRYLVLFEDGREACVTVTTACSVTGLTNGRAYRFVVFAENEVGVSDSSDASPTIVPATTPAAPSGIRGVVASGRVDLEWDPSTEDGGDSITEYVVRVWREAQLERTITTVDTPLRISGLHNGVDYRFTVSASNTVGESMSSISVTLRPVSDPIIDPPVDPPTASAPHQPTGVTVLTTNRRTIVVGWAAPFDGGSPIVDYRIESGPKPRGRFTVTDDGIGTSPVAEIRKPKRPPLFVRIIAINAVGESIPSVATRVLGR